MMFEHFFQCPYCWKEISVQLDSSQGSYEFIEDCEVCCNPIEIQVKFEDTELMKFKVQRVQ